MTPVMGYVSPSLTSEVAFTLWTCIVHLSISVQGIIKYGKQHYELGVCDTFPLKYQSSAQLHLLSFPPYVTGFIQI